jgi:large subunit ribosomal protein L24
MHKIKMGDDAIIIAGKDKGKRGTVLKVTDNGRMIVENCNMAKKHVKPNPNAGETGGIVEKEMPLHASNVALFNPATGKADRVGFKMLEDGKKIRFYKSNNEAVDV